MKNYSSAKLELLALKWAIMETFGDYLLGSKFTAYTDNNILACVSKLGACKIMWLSDLALFNFQNFYHSGRSSRATNALSHHPSNPDSSSKNGSDSEAEVAFSYGLSCSAVWDIIDPHLDGTGLAMDIRLEAQLINSVLEKSEEEDPIDV